MVKVKRASRYYYKTRSKVWSKDRTAFKVAETLWIKVMNYSRKNVTLQTTNEETDALSYTQIFSLNKIKKRLTQEKTTLKKNIFLAFFYVSVTFQCRRYNVLIFFCPQNVEKNPSKVAHIRPQTFFMYWPGCSNQPSFDFS